MSNRFFPPSTKCVGQQRVVMPIHQESGGAVNTLMPQHQPKKKNSLASLRNTWQIVLFFMLLQSDVTAAFSVISPDRSYNSVIDNLSPRDPLDVAVAGGDVWLIGPSCVTCNAVCVGDRITSGFQQEMEPCVILSRNTQLGVLYSDDIQIIATTQLFTSISSIGGNLICFFSSWYSPEEFLLFNQQ